MELTSLLLKTRSQVEAPFTQVMFARLRGLVRKPTATEALAVVGGVAAVYGGVILARKAVRTLDQVRIRAVDWWRGPLQLYPAPNDRGVGQSGLKPESPRAGSEEFAMTPPKCQGLVGFEKNGKFLVAGCCVRIGDWLLVPDHVRSAVNGVPIEIRSMDQSRHVKLTPDEMESLEIIDTDMCFVRLSGPRFAQMGLRSASVAQHLPEKLGAHCSIVGGFGKGTLGTVTHSMLFGKVNYSGSTWNGYSGAAYMLGNSLIGLHLHGGSVNTGFSSSYLLALLKHVEKIETEDSTAWLEYQRDSGAVVVVDPAWRDVDEMRVRISGRYHILDRGLFNKTFGTKHHKVHYSDMETAIPSGEASKDLSGASGSVIVSRPSTEQDSLALTRSEKRQLAQFWSLVRLSANLSSADSEKPSVPM